MPYHLSLYLCIFLIYREFGINVEEYVNTNK